MGTQGHEIYVEEEGQKFKQLTSGHYAPKGVSGNNEAWGMTTAEGDSERVISCSEDGTLRIFSQTENKELMRIDLTANK